MSDVTKLTRSPLAALPLSLLVGIAACNDVSPTAPNEAAFQPPAPDFSVQRDDSGWFDFPFGETLWVACLGENVTLFGILQGRQVTLVNDGGLFKFSFRFKGKITAVGETSGDVYQTNPGPGKVTFTANKASVFKQNPAPIVMHGPNGTNVILNGHFHATTNANGDLTASFGGFNFVCVGKGH